MDIIIQDIKKHPKLLASGKIIQYEGFRILEVFAYTKVKNVTDADHGTIIQFVEIDKASNGKGLVLPGMDILNAEYDNACNQLIAIMG